MQSNTGNSGGRRLTLLSYINLKSLHLAAEINHRKAGCHYHKSLKSPFEIYGIDNLWFGRPSLTWRWFLYPNLYGQPRQPKQIHHHPLRACGEVRLIKPVDKVFKLKQAGRTERVVGIIDGDGTELWSSELLSKREDGRINKPTLWDVRNSLLNWSDKTLTVFILSKVWSVTRTTSMFAMRSALLQ